MKKFAMLMVAMAGLMGLAAGGCSPGYSAEENVGRTLRTWDYDAKQGVDDLMYEAMFVPPSRMTIWHLR